MNKCFVILLIVLSCATMFATGCSKSEQVLAGVSVVAATGGGMSFLKGHLSRNSARRHVITAKEAALRKA